jgi:hypothetical protein
MIYLYFFLKFKTQLRRTRPEIVQQIDESLIKTIVDAGGKITGDRFIISAVLNEEVIAFWLDIFLLIENLKKNIESSNEFYGYSLVITDIMPDAPEMLGRYLANYNGVFVNDRSARKLVPYASFEKPSEWLSGARRRKYGCGNFYRVKELKVFKNAIKDDLNMQKKVIMALDQERGRSKLILCPPYAQIRSGLYMYNQKLNGDFPPLSIYFGSIGLGALVDAWSLSIRSLAIGQQPGNSTTEEIDNLWELLFRERIRDEVSEYIIRCLRRFLNLVFDFYFKEALKKKCTPVIILENIHLAGNKIADVLLEVLNEIDSENKKKLMLLGTGEIDISSEKLKQWEPHFGNIIRLEAAKEDQIYFPKLSTDLWEIIYVIFLFGRYFSPELFQRLLEENDKNPVMITRAFSILHTLGLIDNIREPCPVNRHLEDYARKVLGERHEKIKEMVCGRLLNWAAGRNLTPCFRLLVIISNLDGVQKIDDILLLKSFLSDIINNTVSGIETAMKSGQFDELVTVRAAAIRYIFNTSRALHSGNNKEIEKIFSFSSSMESLSSECDPYPVLKAQILVNLSAYYLGCHSHKEAADKAKEAILLGQSRNSYCLPQAYRLFSLVCLTKKQSAETIEYLNFALSNAEKAGNYDELAISAYYAAAAQFLYGDVYSAARLARKSIEQALATGHPDWADRSRFLEGRLEFELGHYRKAHDIFETLRKDPYGKKTEEKDQVMSAWTYRCKLYFHDPATPKPQPANNDADLFEIEAAYLSGEYQKAVDLSKAIKNPFTEGCFLYTEQAEWRGGFSQCEHLYFTHGEIQDRIKCLYESLALSKVSPEGAVQASNNIQQILRDEKLCEMDPLDAIYFYAKYRILEQAKASLVDLSTVVSMAFKRLQRRAGRIEDSETRRQYMNGSRWNRELSVLAKEYKLI